MKFLLYSFFFFTVAYGQTDSLLLHSCSENGYRKNLPRSKDSVQVVHHHYYSLGYSESHEQAVWVSYVLDSSDCFGVEERSSRFLPDPMVKTGSAVDGDYAKSGYDRGHLAPAGDMGFNAIAMKESFYYSNMSPQIPNFNRGIWKKLETQVREWGKTHLQLLIVTGPVLEKDLRFIGKDEVSIPLYYYKIVVDPFQKQAIGFLLANKPSSEQLTAFVVTVDKIEELAQIDILSELPDNLENQLENQVNSDFWFSKTQN